MNLEMNIVANVLPQKVNTNLLEVSAVLDEVVKSYSVIQYDENEEAASKQMKADRAALNKLKKNIEAKKSEVRKACLNPYEEIAGQFDALVTKVEEPSLLIDSKVKEFEAIGRTKRRKLIRECYDRIYMADPEFKEKLFEKTYNPAWENVSTTVKSWTSTLSDIVKNYTEGMTTIQTLGGNYVKEGIQQFQDSLLLNDAITLMSNKQKEHDRIVAEEAEKIQREAERIQREAEQRRREEAEKIQREAERIQREAERIQHEESARTTLQQQPTKLESSVSAVPVMQNVSSMNEPKPVAPQIQSVQVPEPQLGNNTIKVTLSNNAWKMVERFCRQNNIQYTIE